MLGSEVKYALTKPQVARGKTELRDEKSLHWN